MEKFTNNLSCKQILGTHHPTCNHLEDKDKNKKGNKLMNPHFQHMGYYKSFPIIRYGGNRFLLKKNDLVKYNKKKWNFGNYFEDYLVYRKYVPRTFVNKYKYVGTLLNRQNDSKLKLFERKLDEFTDRSNYKYVVFKMKEDGLKYQYDLPPRYKIIHGDRVFIKHKSSTYGPFVFIDDELRKYQKLI